MFSLDYEDIEIREMRKEPRIILNKKHLGSFEFDRYMNPLGWS
jgi:hypothetical protein